MWKELKQLPMLHVFLKWMVENQQLAHTWHCWNRSSIIVSALHDSLLFQMHPLILKLNIDCHHLMRQCCPPTAAGKIDGALAKAANDFCMNAFYKAKHTRTSTNQVRVLQLQMVKTMYFIRIVKPQKIEYMCWHLLQTCSNTRTRIKEK